MNLKLLIILLLFPLQVFAKEELKVLTYGSFNSDWGPGPNIEKEFESICNCDLIWNTADSSGALLSRVKLTKNNEGFDVLLGLDDSLITEAEENDLFIEHQIEEFNLDLNWKNKFFTPFDYGYFSFIYDQTKLSMPPQSFEELASRNDISVIIMDPRYSTPGLGLAKWIDQVYQEDAVEFWKNLQDQIDTINTSGYDDTELRGLIQGNTDALGDKSDTDHTHDPQDLTHDHDADYAPVHEHPYASDTHDHDADYAPISHDHDDYFSKGSAVDDDGNPLPLPYGDAMELGAAVDDVKEENGDQNDRLDALEAAAPVAIGDNPPSDEKSKDGDLWWDSVRMEMFIRYQDAWITTNALSARVEAGEIVQAELLARVAVGEEQQENLKNKVASLDTATDTLAQQNTLQNGQIQRLSSDKADTDHLHPYAHVDDVADKDHSHDEHLTNSGNQELTQTWKLKSNSKTFMTIADDKMNIYHVADPDNATHVANRNYVDTVKEDLLERINALEDGSFLRPLPWKFMGSSTPAQNLGPGEFTIATTGDQNTSAGRFKIYLNPHDASGKQVVANIDFSHNFDGNFLVSVQPVGGGGGITGKSLSFNFKLAGTPNNYHRLETNWWKVAYSLVTGQEYIIHVPGLLPTFGYESSSSTVGIEESVDGELPASDEQEEQVND